MTGSIFQHHSNASHFLSSETSFFTRVDKPFFYTRHKWLRNIRAGRFITKINFCIVMSWERFVVADDPGILSSSTRLLTMPKVVIDFFIKGFFERHPWLAHFDLAVELAFHSLGINFKVQFAHPRGNGLLVFFVVPNTKCWVFFGEPCHSLAKISLRFFVHWVDRH